MTDEQARERAERYAQRVYAAEAEVHDLRSKYRRLERDRNALLSQLRDLKAENDELSAKLAEARVEAS